MKKSVRKNTTAPTAPFLERHFSKLLFSILGLSAAIYAALNFEYRLGIYNDDALYVLTAKDFWNTLTIHPLLQVKPDYPMPGLPLLLAAFTHISDQNWFLLEWITVAAALICGFLIAKWMRRWFSSGQTLAIVALYALNPLVVRFSGIVMPASYFALAAVSSFYLVDQLLQHHSPKKTLLLGFILGWGSALHPDGVLIAFSVFCGLIYVERGRKLIPPLLAPLAGWGIFMAMWFHHRSVPKTEYGSDLAALLDYWKHSFTPAFTFLFTWFESTMAVSWGFLHLLSPVAQDNLTILLFALLIVGLGVGFFRAWKIYPDRRPVIIGFGMFFVLFVAVHVFWHVPDARYFVPILPFVIIAFCAAIPSKTWATALFAIVITANIFENAHSIYRSVTASDPLNRPPYGSLQWLKENAPANARVLSNIAPSVDLYTGHPASPLLNVTSVDMLQYVMLKQNFDYIFLRRGNATASDIGGTENVNIIWERYRRWVEHYPKRFPRAYKGPSRTARIHRVQSDPSYVPAYEKFISACSFAQKQQYTEAFQDTQASLKINPHLGCAVNMLGVLYFLTGNTDLAEKSLLQASTLLPDSPNAWINLASLYNFEKKTPASLEALQKAININSANGDDKPFREKALALPQRWERNDRELFIDFYTVF